MATGGFQGSHALCTVDGETGTLTHTELGQETVDAGVGFSCKDNKQCLSSKRSQKVSRTDF